MVFLRALNLGYTRLALGSLLLMLCSANVGAGVNLKNGNFYISYTDIVLGGGRNKVEVIRTYNSKAVGSNMFGFGWGSDTETFLKLHADGRLVVHENGAGSISYFERLGYGNAEMRRRHEEIAEQLSRLSAFASSEMRDVFVSSLSVDREAALLRIGALTNLVQPPSLDVIAPIGEGFKSEHRVQERIVRDALGYTRMTGKDIDRFDLAGKLTFSLEDGVSLSIVRDSEGKVMRLSEGSGGEALNFQYNSHGQVTSVINPKTGERADYRYNGANLVWTRDMNGNIYEHAYDSRHNMTSIKYQDGTEQNIDYHPASQRVARVVDRAGQVTSYEYHSIVSPEALSGVFAKSGDKVVRKYGTKVSRTTEFLEVEETNHEFEISVGPNGATYTTAIISSVGSQTTERHYNRSRLPLLIVEGERWSEFKYNGEGLLVEKRSSDGSFASLEYDAAAGKISRVINNEGMTEFSYNHVGNLIRATKNDRSVILSYNAKNEINKMVSNEGTILFSYGELGKPIAYTLEGVGSIFVKYDLNGEIAHVDSSDGPQVAGKVSRVLGSLLALSSPANVDLEL